MFIVWIIILMESITKNFYRLLIWSFGVLDQLKILEQYNKINFNFE